MGKLDEGVVAMGGETLIGVAQHKQDWTQNAALQNTSVEDSGGGWDCVHPDMPRSIQQKVLDLQTDGVSESQHLRFVD